MCHAVVELQSEMVAPLMIHLRTCSQLLIRAMKNRKLNGLHFRRLRWPLQVLSMSDASHASKKTGYPYDGKIVMVRSDTKTD